MDNEEVAKYVLVNPKLFASLFGDEGPWRDAFERAELRDVLGLEQEAAQWVDRDSFVDLLTREEFLELLSYARKNETFAIQDILHSFGISTLLEAMPPERILSIWGQSRCSNTFL